MRTAINNKPCITDDEVIIRMIEDKAEIRIMKSQGYNILTTVCIHSKETFECHCLPIFREDKFEDICNRYYDYFPKECKQLIGEVKAINQTLYDGQGFSKELRLLQFKAKIPLGLLALLDMWAGGDYLSKNVKTLRKNINRIISYMSKFKIGVSYGKTRIAT